MNVAVCGWKWAEMRDHLAKANQATSLILFNECEFQYTSLGNTPGWLGLVEYANARNIPFYVITGSCSDSPPWHDVNDPLFKQVQPLIYWQTFFMAYTYNEMIKHDINLAVCDPKQFKHAYISLNAGRPHFHRCNLMDNIYHMGLLDKGIVSFKHSDSQEFASQSDFYQWKYWTPKTMLYDENFDQWAVPDIYNHCFMTVVSETTLNDYIVSEKTTTPILLRKPFLVSGPTGFYQRLRDLGYVLYDEIFDYSFDNEPDLDHRNKMILANVSRVADLTASSWHDLYVKIKDKIEYNRELLIRHSTDKSYVPEFVRNLYESGDPCIDCDHIMKSVLNVYYGKNYLE